MTNKVPYIKHINVQAGEVNYALHSLGWKSFQNLCATIAAEVWGQVIETFLDSNDGGRDGAFCGSWKQKSGEAFEGTFTAQCKFTAAPDAVLQPSDLNNEVEKAYKLALRGLCDNYILFTNAGLTGVTEADLRPRFEAIPGVKHFAAYGRERISQIIHESPRLRMLVPQIYGLGDLSQILDVRANLQAKEILSAISDDLSKFVVTEAYRQSAKALSKYGFVLLLGEPACGKSIIASALSLSAMDQWGCFLIKTRNANDFVEHFNPNEPKQFFWVDDAFGSTQFDLNSVVEWNTTFPHLQAAIRRGARVVFTSRDYIYRSALQHIKESSFPLIGESQVIIQVEKLSKTEREQILYNHIKLGSQPKNFKTEIKPFLPRVATNEDFTPEIARRLGNPVFTKRLTISEATLNNFVAQPLEFLCEIIRTLDTESQSALALVFMRAGALPSPIQMTEQEQNAMAVLGGSLGGIRNALNSLRDSLVILSFRNGVYEWHYKHPTIRDAYAIIISKDTELMDIYLMGVPIEKLFQEVSCGDVGIEGLRVIVPNDRFDAIMTRMEAFDITNWNKRNQLNWFLAYRCNKDFLSGYIARGQQFISSLRVGSYLNAWSDVQVIIRLHELGLLPEANRKEFVWHIRALAAETPDSGFLQESMSHILTKDELADILEHVRTDLIMQLDNQVDNWRMNYTANDDPDDYFDLLTGALEDYRKSFENDPDAIFRIENALAEIEDIVAGLRSEFNRTDDLNSGDEQRPLNEAATQSRSTFEDVDV